MISPSLTLKPGHAICQNPLQAYCAMAAMSRLHDDAPDKVPQAARGQIPGAVAPKFDGQGEL